MGGWNDPTETIIAGSGQAYIAPVGTALPAAEDSALNTAFFGLGYHTEDGASVNQSRDVIRHRAWQTKFDVRRTSESEAFQVTFALEQWNEQSLPLAFGGGTVSEPGAGTYKYAPPEADDEEYERSLVLDVIDGETILRFVVPRGTAVEGVESQFARSQMGVLPITFEALQTEDGNLPWFLFTNSAAFAAGS